MKQSHFRFLEGMPAFEVVATAACCYQIRPDFLAAQVARKDMIYRQRCSALAAILASIIIPAKNFAPGKFDSWPGTVYHVIQTDNGGNRIGKGSGMDLPTAVADQRSLTGDHQADRPLQIAHIDRLKICVEH